MDSSQFMGKQSIGRLLWMFSLPAIVGMVVNALYNIVARIFVGRGVGSLGLAATAVALPIMTIIMALSILVGVGATALISIRLGEQKKAEAEVAAGNAMLLLILLPVFFSGIFFIFSESILTALGSSAAVYPYARDYVTIIMFAAPIISFSMGANNFIRAEGNPRMAMYTQIIGAIINIILNYVFIFIFGWGIKGSALATLIAQSVAALWVLSYFLSGRSLIKIYLRNLKPQLPIISSIMAIGFAPSAMQFATSVQQVILNKALMHYGGDLALSAIGIMMSIGMLLFMPILGINQGAQPLIGFNYGAKQYSRVIEAWKKAVLVASCIAITGFIVIRLFSVPLAGLFSQGDTALTNLTSHAMLIYFTAFPIVGFQVIGATYFQSVGKPVQAAILSLSRQVLLFIPLLLILPDYWGIEGIWRTAPIADCLAVMLTAAFVFNELKKLKAKSAEALSAKIPEEG
ncbi:MAG TPA: MATE family efflux transporter [Syntrophomonadaceae bacterium]|nr:MATE family efflux transporter [Syntrophomonadaceae bacterium]HNX29799.1 MATE family efflux transporter [Syntrophomonadaceae bacterium]HPR94329.1 MATE family efflux transporter [Syntrophomonadaceae bacterium]